MRLHSQRFRGQSRGSVCTAPPPSPADLQCRPGAARRPGSYSVPLSLRGCAGIRSRR